MIEVFNTQVYGIEEALVRAGYPMRVDIGRMADMIEQDKNMFSRGANLGFTNVGEGHDKFLRMITVNFDLKAPRYFWQEFDTYGFTVKNSQSTMHRMSKLKLEFTEWTDPVIVGRFALLIKQYNENPSFEKFMTLKSSLPEGFMLTAGITTNYCQLKTMYKQRRNHRLPEWHIFCDWIKSLPKAKELGVCGNLEA